MAASFDITAAIQLQAPNNIDAISSSIQSKLSGIKTSIDVNIPAGTSTRIKNLNDRLDTLNKNLVLVATNATSAAAAIQTIGSSLDGTSTRLSNLQAYLKAVSSGFVNIGKNVQPASDTIEKFGQQSALAARRFSAFTVAAGAIIGAVAGIKTGLTEAINFQQQIVKIGQITQQSTNNLKPLVDEVTRLGVTFGVSSKSLIEISNTLAQAGLSAKDTRTALEALAKTTLSPTFGDIKNTTEAAISAMAQFSIAAGDFEKVFGSLNSVAAAFAVEAQDLTTVITKAGGVFKTLSGDIDAPITQLNQLVALFTSVRQTTRESADTIATGFRTIFGRLERPQTLQFLEAMGVKLTDLKGNFIGVFPAVRELNKALSEIPSTSPEYAKIVEQIGGLRQISKVIPLIQQFPVALRALQVAQAGQNSLTVDASRSQEAFAQRLSKVKEEFLDLFRVISQNQVFTALADGFLRTATAIAQITKALEPLIPLLTAYAAVKFVPAAASFGKGFFNYFTTQGVAHRAQGGEIPHFSRGGYVPGHGTGDTVPAMLEPKEFVIKQSSTSKVAQNHPGVLEYINKYGVLPQRRTTGDEISKYLQKLQDSTRQSSGTEIEYKPNELRDLKLLRSLKSRLSPVYKPRKTDPKISFEDSLEYFNDTGAAKHLLEALDDDPKLFHKVQNIIPKEARLIGTGRIAAAFGVPNSNEVFRVGADVGGRSSGKFSRTDSPLVVQPNKTNKLGPVIVERLPFAQSLHDLGFSRADIYEDDEPSFGSRVTGSLLEKFHQRAKKTGLKAHDIHSGNIGFLDKRLVAIDPDAVRFARGGVVGRDDISKLLINYFVQRENDPTELPPERILGRVGRTINNLPSFIDRQKLLSSFTKINLFNTQGQINNEGRRGKFSPHTGVIDSNLTYSTLAHELTHAYDYSNKLGRFQTAYDYRDKGEPNELRKLVERLFNIDPELKKKTYDLDSIKYLRRPHEILARGVGDYTEAKILGGNSYAEEVFGKIRKRNFAQGDSVRQKFQNKLRNQRDQKLFGSEIDFSDFPEDFGNTQQMDTQGLFNKVKKLNKLAKGGEIPGYGEGDSVPALLTPKEFVVQKDSAQSFGYSNLRYINEHGRLPGYNKGGIVGMAGGGLFNKEQEFGAVYSKLSLTGRDQLSDELYRANTRLLESLGEEYDNAKKASLAHKAFTNALTTGDKVITNFAGKIVGLGAIDELVKARKEVRRTGIEELDTVLNPSLFSRITGKKIGKGVITAGLVGGSLFGPELLRAGLGEDKAKDITAGGGGAAAGLYTGGAIGSAVGGIPGAVIGAILGAITLGLTSYLTSAKNTLAEKQQKDVSERQANFNETLASNINKIGLDSKARAAISGSQGLITDVEKKAKLKAEEGSFFGLLPFNFADVGATQTEIDRRKKNIVTSTLRENTLGGYAPALQNLEKLAQETRVKTGGTPEDRAAEFEAKLKATGGGAGGQLLGLVADYKSISEGSLNRKEAEAELLKTLKEEAELRNKNLSLIKTSEDLADKFKDMYNNITEFTTRLQVTNGKIEDLNGSLGDVLSGQNIKLRGVTENLITQPSRFTPDANSPFKEALGGLLEPLGAAGKELGSFILDQRKAIAELDPILKSVARTSTARTIESDIRGGLKQVGVSGITADSVIANLQAMGGAAEGLDKVLINLQTDTVDTINKIKKDLLDFSTPLGQAGQQLDKLNTQIYDSAVRISTYNDKVREETVKISDITLQQREVGARRQAERFGGSPLNYISLQAEQEPFRQRVRSLAGTENPQQIGQNIIALSTQLKQLRDNASNLKDETAKLKFADLQTQIRNSEQALRLLASASERSAKIEERLSLLKQQEEGRFDFFKRLVTAKPEELPQLNKEILSANALVQHFNRGGSLDQLPAQVRTEGASALAGPFSRFAFRSANNLTGEDILKQFQQRGLPSIGLPAGLLSYNLKERNEKSGLEGEQNRVFESAKEAQQQLANVYQNAAQQQQEIFSQSVDIFKNSVVEFAKLLQADADRYKNQPLIDKQKVLTGALGRAPVAEDLDTLNAFKRNKETISGAVSATKTLESLNKIKDIRSELPNILNKAGDDFDKISLSSSVGTRVSKLTNNLILPSQLTEIFENVKKTRLQEIKDQSPYPYTFGLVGGSLDRKNELQKDFNTNVQEDFFRILQDNLTKLKTDQTTDITNARNNSGLGSQFDVFVDKFDQFGKVLENVDLNKFNDLISSLKSVPVAETKANGGSIFRPRGTDVVPAMLSPDEYIVNSRSSIANRSLLDRINSAKGPVYLAGGGEGSGKKRRRKRELSQEELDDLVKDNAKLKRSEELETRQIIKNFSTDYIKYKEGREGTIIPSNVRNISKYEYALNVLSKGGGDVRTGPFKELNKNQPAEQFKQNTGNLLDQLSESGLIKTRASELREVTKQLDREKYIKEIRKLSTQYKDSPTALKFAISELVTGQRGAAISKESRPELRVIQALEAQLNQSELKDPTNKYYENDEPITKAVKSRKQKAFTGFDLPFRKNSKAYKEYIARQRSIPDFEAYGPGRPSVIQSTALPFYPSEDIGFGGKSGLPAVIPKTLGRRPFVPTPDVINLGGPVFQEEIRQKALSSRLNFTVKPSTVGRPRGTLATTIDIASIFKSGGTGQRIIDTIRPPVSPIISQGLVQPSELTFATSGLNIPASASARSSKLLNRAADLKQFGNQRPQLPSETPIIPGSRTARQPIPIAKSTIRLQEFLQQGFGERIRGPLPAGQDLGFGTSFVNKTDEFRNLTDLEKLAGDLPTRPGRTPFYEGRAFRTGAGLLAAYNLYESGKSTVEDISKGELTVKTAESAGITLLSATQLSEEAKRLTGGRTVPLEKLFTKPSLLKRTGGLFGRGLGKLGGGIGVAANVAYAGAGVAEAYQAGYGNLGYSSYDEPSFQRGVTRAVVGAGALIPGPIGKGIGTGILAGEAAADVVGNYNPVARIFGGISKEESERQKALSAQGSFGKELDPINALERQLQARKIPFTPYAQFTDDKLYKESLKNSLSTYIRNVGAAQVTPTEGLSKELSDAVFEGQSQGERNFYRDKSIKAAQVGRAKLENNQDSQDQFQQLLEDDPEFRRRYLNNIGRGYNLQFRDIKNQFGGSEDLLFKADGGSIFKKRGTDTIPAMLSPDEFIVNATSAKANRDILEKINAAKGPIYRADGGFIKKSKYTKEELDRILAGEVINKVEQPRDVSASFDDVAFGKRLEQVGKGVPTSSIQSKTFDIDSTKNVPYRRPIIGDNEGFVSTRSKNFDIESTKEDNLPISDNRFFNSKQNFAIKRFRTLGEINKQQKSPLEITRENILKKRAAAFESRKLAEEGVTDFKVQPHQIDDGELQEKLKAGNISGEITGFDVKREQRVSQQKEQADKIALLQDTRRQIKADNFAAGREERKQNRVEALERARIAAAPETKIDLARARDKQKQAQRLNKQEARQQRLLPGREEPLERKTRISGGGLIPPLLDTTTGQGPKQQLFPGDLGVTPIGPTKRSQTSEFQGVPTTQAGAAPGAATNAPQAQAQPAFDVGGLTQSVTGFGGFVTDFGKYVGSLTELAGKLTDLKVTLQTDKLTVTIAEKDILTEINKNMTELLKNKIDVASKGGPDENGNLS